MSKDELNAAWESDGKSR